jgi:hypothetical protein
MNQRVLANAEVFLIIVLASVPLFSSFPYRVNIFLSWEGAYRMSQGELPFRDFGTPLGGMYWVIPAIFFKIFGAKMITLVKAQVFINIIAGLSFRSILKSLPTGAAIRFVSILLFCISYSFFNFWPWYNHTVIVYELVALAFLFKYIAPEAGRRKPVWLVLSALFICCSFMTKQDAGGMAFMIATALMVYFCLTEKRWRPLVIFGGSFLLLFLLIILFFSQYAFGYWFNHGQPPHTARVSLSEIFNDFFLGSQMIKFYLFLIVVLVFIKFKSWNALWSNRTSMLFLLLTLAMIAEATVFQVTSYTPPDNNIFYHSFAIAFILYMLSQLSVADFDKPAALITLVAGVLLWWSSVYWKYVSVVTDRLFPKKEIVKQGTGENVVNRSTYIISNDEPDIPMSEWKFTGLRSFDKIYMPEPTVKGIERLMNMPMVKNKPNLRVLNMSELTPLAVEIPFKLERGPEIPLWYHLGVAMFNKQAVMYEDKIAKKQYDLVLFEYIPSLNNFYPFRVRDSLKVHYKMVDSIYAPRRGDTRGMIEVYVK